MRNRVMSMGIRVMSMHNKVMSMGNRVKSNYYTVMLFYVSDLC